MTGWDDLEGVTPKISSQDAERLLLGTSGNDETDELAELSAVLGALRQPAEPDELSGLASVLVAFGVADVTTLASPSPSRTLPMMKKRLTRKSLAAIGVITLVSAGAAAAAGVVPTPFSAPRPSVATPGGRVADDSTKEDDAVDTTSTTEEIDATEIDATDPVETEAVKAAVVAADAADTTDGRGPDVNGPAKFGLCTAYQARTKHDEATTTTQAPAAPLPANVDSNLPVPFQALSDAAVAAGKTVAEFCADAVPGGSADAPGKSGDSPSATAPGKSGDSPSATAPGKSAEPQANPGKKHGQPATTHP